MKQLDWVPVALACFFLAGGIFSCFQSTDNPQDSDSQSTPSDIPAEAVDEVLETAMNDVFDGPGRPVVVPGELNLGSIEIGCSARSLQACVVNAGHESVSWGGFSLTGCDESAFRVANPQGLPMLLEPGSSACSRFHFAPYETGHRTCEAIAVFGDTDLGTTWKVVLQGAGLEAPLRHDEFTAPGFMKQDFLLVLDDSPSMCAIREAMLDQLEMAEEKIARWTSDYHVGVLVGTADPGRAGRLNGGRAELLPRYLTPNAWISGDLVRLGDMGCEGTMDGAESAMTSIRASFNPELSLDWSIPCSEDNQCVLEVCADPALCNVQCIEGGCRGINAGFFREEAGIHVVIVSDDMDHGDESAEQFLEFMRNLKGSEEPYKMGIHAVVTPEEGCVDGSAWTLATESNSYVELANQTGGSTWSICEDWASIFDLLHGKTWHPMAQYFLSKLARPESIRVDVNLEKCPADDDNWRFDAPSNSIIFNERGSCFPGPGSRIHVTYLAICLGE
jgi:hypothetical protein